MSSAVVLAKLISKMYSACALSMISVLSSPFWFSIGVIGSLNLIFFNLCVFTLGPGNKRKTKHIKVFGVCEELCGHFNIIHIYLSCSEITNNTPFLRPWIDCVSQCVVGVVLERHPRCWVPLGVLFTEAFLGVSSESQFLSFTKLHQQNVCCFNEV